MSAAQAVAYALAADSEDWNPRAAAASTLATLTVDDAGRPLTRREIEVAVLLAAGCTNRQIADRLTVTVGTAGVHVVHILNKLGLHFRWQVADWAVAQGLIDDAST